MLFSCELPAIKGIYCKDYCDSVFLAGVVVAILSYDFQKVGRDIVTVSVSLFRVMIPTLIVVKLAQELGIEALLVGVLAPVMSWMDLPASLAVVLVTTILTNPYAGLIVAASVPEMTQLTMGQTSIIALFMLFAHGLPLEAMISQKVGVRLWFVIFVRLGAAILSGIILAQLFGYFSWYQAPAIINLPQMTMAADISGWLVEQIYALIIIQLVIIALIAVLELLRIVGIERLMIILLAPILRVMGIGDRASTIAIVGVTLGVGFGSGLLMKEVQTGTIPKKDVFGVVCFINLIHSVFEDTAVVFVLGPSLFVIVALRLLFAIVITMACMAAASLLTDAQWHRYLTNSNIPASAG